MHVSSVCVYVQWRRSDSNITEPVHGHLESKVAFINEPDITQEEKPFVEVFDDHSEGNDCINNYKFKLVYLYVN